MYLDKQANGAAAAVSDISETATWRTFNNLSNSGRFVILMDKTINMNYCTLGIDGVTNRKMQVFYDDQFHKKVNIPIEFSGITGGITEIKSNNIGILLFSRQGLVEFNSNVRVRYEG